MILKSKSDRAAERAERESARRPTAHHYSYSYSITGNDADEAKLADAILAAVEKHGGEVISFVSTGGEVNVSDLEEARGRKAAKGSKKDED